MDSALPLRIMLVEDNPGDVRLLREALRELSDLQADLTHFDRLTPAVRRLAEERFDVVLLDLSLPESRGLETFLCMREAVGHIPIVVLSGLDDESLALRAVKEGAQDYLVKGQMSPPLLARSIRYAIEREAMLAQLRERTLELQAREEGLRGVITTNADAMVVVGEGGSIRFSNPAAHSLLRATDERFPFPLGENGRVEVELDSPEGPRTVEMRVVRTEWEGQPAFLATLRDTTERKRNEQVLRKFRSVVEQTADLVIITDRTGVVEYVNAAFTRLTGWSLDDLRGRTLEVLKSGQHDAAFYRDLWATLLAGKPYQGVFVNRRRDGGLYHEEKIITPIREESGHITHFVSTGHDITERMRADETHRRLEEQLLQAQKMEAIGQLAGGVAHDFNNTLMAITGYTEMLLRRLAPGDAQRRILEQVLKAAAGSASLTRQLLAFSRRQVFEAQVLDLNSALVEMEALVRPLLREDVELELRLGPGACLVRVDPGQLQQVVMNLVINARDALHGRGRIVLEAGVRGLLPAAGQPGPEGAREFAVLTVSDTGCGMDEATQSHVFEPFFTTKGRLGGTGLGLSTVYGIVSQSGGHVELESRQGEGTTFRILLPLVERAGPEAEHSAQAVEAPRGEALILVDDNALVRGALAEMLREGGYAVQEAENLEGVLEAIRADGPPHLLVTDVVMAGMNGRDLAARVRALHPMVKVLFLSGYADEGAALERDLGAHAGFLAKPANMDALTRKIRDLLDGSPAPQ